MERTNEKKISGIIMMLPKITVITVVYNGVLTLEATIKSVITQTYSNLEYIIIDGGSIDGTLVLLEKYKEQIAVIVSEKDNGIYDAMNKGLALSTGEWICFMNSGDIFSSCNVLSSIFGNNNWIDVDVIYGDAIQMNGSKRKLIVAGDKLSQLNYHPIYRHTASFVRNQIHKQFYFDLNLQEKINYALDFYVIHHLYKKKARFMKVECSICSYLKEGTSNHFIKNLWYNYLITNDMKFSVFSFVKWFLMIVRFRLESCIF